MAQNRIQIHAIAGQMNKPGARLQSPDPFGQSQQSFPIALPSGEPGLTGY